jgi:hypothetical protein
MGSLTRPPWSVTGIGLLFSFYYCKTEEVMESVESGGARRAPPGGLNMRAAVFRLAQCQQQS